MNAPHSRKPRSNNEQHYDRHHTQGPKNRTIRGNFATPAGRSHNALPNHDMDVRRRMRNLSANNRVENFAMAGAGGNMDVMSRSQYDRAYSMLYNRLAQNAYHAKQGQAPGWSKC